MLKSISSLKSQLTFNHFFYLKNKIVTLEFNILNGVMNLVWLLNLLQ